MPVNSVKSLTCCGKLYILIVVGKFWQEVQILVFRRKDGYKMKKYEKPVVIVNEELAEGIYTASGDSDNVDAGVANNAISVGSVKEKTVGDQWNKTNTYGVTIKNSGNTESKDWSVTVTVSQGTATGAQVYNGWQASASLSGNTITITSGGGGAIAAGGSIEVEVVVQYSSNSIKVTK